MRWTWPPGGPLRVIVRAAVWLAALVAIAIVVPLTGSPADIFFWTRVAVTALYATSVSLLLGMAGIPSFGQAAYFGIGAYAVGILHTTGIPLVGVLLCSTAVATLVAALVAGLSLRATGIAFSMVTLAFAQALYTIVFQADALGGENGIVGLLPGDFFGLDLSSGPTILWLFILAVVAGGFCAMRLVTVSPLGRTLRMIRDDPVRTAFLGIPVRRYQVAAFGSAGGVAGLSGALYAYVQGLVVPDYLYWTHSGEPIIISIIGGMHYFLGPVVGTVVYMWTADLLAELTAAWVLWVGLAFLIVVLAAPGGLLGLPATLRSWQRRGRDRLGRGPGPDGRIAAGTGLSGGDIR